MKFMRSVRLNLKVGDWFLYEFDLCKYINTMIAADDDSKGVIAAFNPLFRRMESWLFSTKQQTVIVINMDLLCIYNRMNLFKQKYSRNTHTKTFYENYRMLSDG
jgi:uncharacterized SAM-dependent methyltransferase